MATSLISPKFKDRDDVEFLAYLEIQVELLKSKTDSTYISMIMRHLDVLELAQHTATLPGQPGAVRWSALGLAGSTTGTPSACDVCSVGVPPPGDGGVGADINPSLLPLPDALAQLILAMDPAAGKAKGSFLRPK